MMGGFGVMAGMGWLGFLTMILFWAGVILLVIWGVSAMFPAQNTGGGVNALAILEQRFARGEISREEFEQARRVLQQRGDNHA
jgi:putative membrane protein